MPLEASFKALCVWNPILEKMEYRDNLVGRDNIYQRKEANLAEEYAFKLTNFLSFFIYHFNVHN